MKHAEKTCGDSVMNSLLDMAADLPDMSQAGLALPTEHPMILRVIGYIDENFATVVCCDEIASQFFISRYRLEHLFKECIGISLWDYVILKRITHFNTVIRRGGSIKAAAYASGFKNYSNFYRLYKKHMGQTPTEYKQKIGKRAHAGAHDV